MDAATAWAEAMKYENRPNPYPYFEELRKTPVAKVSDHTYVVTGYPEAVALAHDPRISSDISRSPSGLFGETAAKLDAAEQPQARDSSMLVADPPFLAQKIAGNPAGSGQLLPVFHGEREEVGFGSGLFGGGDGRQEYGPPLPQDHRPGGLAGDPPGFEKNGPGTQLEFFRRSVHVVFLVCTAGF